MTEHEQAYHDGFLAGMNLSAAIQKAGGSVGGIETRFREGMTIDKFMVQFGRTNGIVQLENGRYRFNTPQEE